MQPEIRARHLKPRLVARRGSSADANSVDPHGTQPRSALASLAKICIWFLEEWYAWFFLENRKALLICDRYYHDLLVDPRRYRYGGPMWAARLVAELMPQPRMWVLLDAPTEVLRARKQEVSIEETARQRDAYRAFVQTQRNHLIVDASQTLQSVIDDLERAVSRLASGDES
jgi:thymidylate kinase